uniref:F-box domain-containing protein n=1 Tax=Lactuca sativa TaxID=4236 RepID=A0A9R1XIV9_LACSA|nr:hypothetical protein LSAT_V11C400162590 [Lactuca sativa]
MFVHYIIILIVLQLVVLETDVFIEILSRTSLKTFHIIRCTSKRLEKLTCNKHVLDLYKRKNNVLHGFIVQQKKPWGTIERQFVPLSGAKSFGIGCLPKAFTILATSLNRLIVGECDNRDEYPNKFLFVCKPTTLDAKSLPFPIYKYIAVNDLTNDHGYENFQVELFHSTTWEWRDLGNFHLLSSFHPVLAVAIISKDVVYILLSNYEIL